MNFDTADNKITTFLSTKSGKRTKLLLLTGFVLFIFAVQLFFNYLTPLTFDDYGYSYVFGTNEKVLTISQIIKSEAIHYQEWSGRITNHTIAQFFLMLNNMGLGLIWEFCNPLIYIALIFLIYYHSKGSFKGFKLSWFMGIHLCLWFFIPAYAESFYWLIGSSNYCWSMVIALLFMVPFTYHSSKNSIQKPNIVLQIVFSILYIFCGIIAGNTNENTAVALVVMMILFGIKALLEKKKLRIWMFSGFVGVVIGMGAMLLSPGQLLRAEKVGGFGGIAVWIKNAVFITIDVFEYLALPLILLFVVLILVFATNKKMELKSFYSFLIFLIGSGASIYCMIVSPSFPERSWTPPVIFAIIAFGQLISLINNENEIYRKAVCAVLAIATISFGTSYVASYLDMKQTFIAYNEREAHIAEQIEKGETTLIMKPVRGWRKYNLFGPDGDLGSRSDEWPNTSIATYYGVEKIINSESKEGIQYDIF